MRVSVFGILLFAYTSHVQASVSTAQRNWSAEFLNQAKDLSCEPGQVRDNVTFLHGTKSGNFTKLGKVAELEVCMLLCCELDRCQAAFLAGTNCYAVTCFSPNHCVTAPALNNKWKPMVAFVTRSKDVMNIKEATNELTNKKDSKSTSHLMNPSRTTEIKETPIIKKGGNAGNHAASIKTTAKKKVHLERFFTENKRVNSTKTESESKSAISTDGKADTLELEELQKQDKSKRKVARAHRHSAKYSLVSAAVATCLMAFLLSGCAVIAAKIRKRNDTPQYSGVPDAQD